MHQHNTSTLIYSHRFHPQIYEVHQEQIDAHVGMMVGQLMTQYPAVRAKFVDTFGGIWGKVAAFMPNKAKAQ